MNSKKILILTLSSDFIIIALFITLLFIILGVFNKYYYSSVLKYNSFKHTSNTGLGKRDAAKIEPLGKVSFLLGTSKFKHKLATNF